MPAVELFSYEACPFAQRTRMALIEKGLEFQLTEIDINNKPDWWSELSPYGNVPLLRYGDDVIYESAIINQYLDELFPDPPLMPAEPGPRARARIWMDYCDSRFGPACYGLITAKDESARNDKREALSDCLRFMENEGMAGSGGGPFWMGETVSLVDLQYAPFFERFPVYEEVAGAEIPTDCVRIRKWLDAMSARPSVEQTKRAAAEHLARYKERNRAA